MNKFILLTFVILFAIYNRPVIENVVLSCCGGVKHVDPTDPEPPKRIKRCVKSWYMPCTNKGASDCCEGVDRCIPSHRGGKCRRRDGSGFYIYDDGELVDYERTEHDTSVDEDESNVEIMDPGEYLQYFNYFILLLIILTIMYVIYNYYFKSVGERKSHFGSDKYYESKSKYRNDYSRGYGRDYGRDYGRGYGSGYGSGYGRSY